jgi:hypothetical protein
MMPRLAIGELEMGYGFGEQARNASRRELDGLFARMNSKA